MRTLLTSIVVGVLLGLGGGWIYGLCDAAFVSWSPELETNQGEAFAKLGSPDEKQADGSDAEPTGKQPRVKVDELVFDFGILEKTPANEKGEHPFYIENVGEADMTLADGGKGCFCTSFSISKKTLKPGEKATVLFKWDGARSGGVFNQGVRVLTNDPKMKEVTFAVKGLYTMPVIGNPPEIVFNSVSPNQGGTRVFRIIGFEKNEDETPFDLKINEIELTDPEHFTVEYEQDSVENMSDEDKSNRLLSQTTSVFNATITMAPGMPQGAFEERMRVKTNSSRMPILEIPIRGQITSSAIKVVGPLYDDKIDGVLKLNEVVQSAGKKTTLKINIQDRIPANEETVRVKSKRPDWINVSLTYPDAELQKVSPIRLIDVTVEIPSGSPVGSFTGPGKEQMGEIVFEIGADESTKKELVIPVRFAVSP